MTRSVASLERRRAYSRAWRLAHPSYHRTWRAEHRESERQRVADWRRRWPELARAQKARYRRAHLRPPSPELPPKHLGHPIFEAARQLVGPDRNSGLRWLIDPLHEDLLSEAALALVEGRDAAEAVRQFRSREYAWRARIGSILPGFAEVWAAW